MARVLGNGMGEVKSQNELVLALKQGNVVRAGSHRDVTESTKANVTTFGSTSRRERVCN